MFINKVTLYSSKLDEIKEFYSTTLGFEVMKSDVNGFVIKVGDSVIEFLKNQTDTDPFYHFALNIPHNQFKEAKEWARERVSLNKDEGGDEVHFAFLDSHAFYFNDPSGNVVELIARRNTRSKETEFSANSVLNISEINLTVDNVVAVAEQLIQFGVPVRENEAVEEDSLNFLGEAEEAAFLLLGPPDRRWIFSDKFAEIHPITVQVDNRKLINFDGSRLSLESID